MNCLAPAAHLEPLVSRNLSYERLTSAINLHCGRGRRFTVGELSEGAGVPVRSIECARFQTHQAQFRPMRLEYLLSMSKFLRAPFVSHFLEPAGLGAFELMNEQPLPSILSADAAKPAETPREKVERLQRELFNAIEDMTA